MFYFQNVLAWHLSFFCVCVATEVSFLSVYAEVIWRRQRKLSLDYCVSHRESCENLNNNKAIIWFVIFILFLENFYSLFFPKWSCLFICSKISIDFPLRSFICYGINFHSYHIYICIYITHLSVFMKYYHLSSISNNAAALAIKLFMRYLVVILTYF